MTFATMDEQTDDAKHRQFIFHGIYVHLFQELNTVVSTKVILKMSSKDDFSKLQYTKYIRCF